MGKVYPWSVIKVGNVPQLSDFQKVIAYVRNAFEDEAILGGLITGSVLRGDHTRRSDLDCVVIYKTAREEYVMQILRKLQFDAQKLHVPLGFIPCDSRTAGSSMHHFGPAFCIHLESSVQAGGVIKENPLWEINRIGQSMKDEIESYVRMKLYKLQEGWSEYVSMGEERQAEFLRKVLEASLHLARKILQLQDPDFKDDSKASIFERYIERMSPNMVEDFRLLISTDRAYTVELNRQLDSLDSKSYQRVWQDIEEIIPLAVQFVRNNLLYLSKNRA